MHESVLVALITGGMSLLGVIITGLATARRNENAMKVAQAVTDTKLDELTREVREHNNFARRLPVVENEITNIHGTLEELKRFHRKEA